ncbi:MAG: endo-1,4-beta-xylanase [Ruminococcus sp.]|nr:endo-1,4-beta-xylanase [Ruminococcus sp.]
MNHRNTNKFTAAILSAAMMLSSVPAVMPAVAADEETGQVIVSTDFEDGENIGFSNRGGDDTTEISIVEDSDAGNKVLQASGRTQSWNGPAFQLDKVCKPYTEYYVNFRFKAKYYAQVTVSFQHDDADGNTQYKNLIQNLQSGGWVEVKNLKVSYSDDMSNVFLYLEGGSDDLFIDDFSITEVPPVEIEQDIPSLSNIYSPYFKFGTAITADNLASKPFMSLVEKHFNGSMTVGNEMKPDAVLDHNACLKYVEENGDDTVPQISFSKAKGILNYCQKNKIPMRVHTLVWHSQTPDWFFKENYDPEGEWVSKEKMLKRMENYIKIYFETLTELYPDVDFYACDVVNEAWTNDGKPRDPGEQGQGGSEKSAWVQVFGDNSFIEPAFTYARKYAPKGCKLYYNDFNEYMDKKTKIAEMALDLKEKGLIDGIGMQSHLDCRESAMAAFPSIDSYEKALDLYCSTGLDVQITELDVTVPDQSGDKYFEWQGEYYRGIMDAIMKHKDNVSAVIVWGVTDDLSWRVKQSPLLFGGDYVAKPAYYSLTKGMDVPEVVTTTTKPAETTTTSTATTTAEETTTTTKGTSGGDLPIAKITGDANGDAKVTVSDAVAILQYIGNKDKYPLTAEQLENADCYNPGDGVTPRDALSIQRLDAKAISSLPELAE